MKPTLLNRRVHYWLTLVVAIPLLTTVTTGILLQLKKHWTWVQPSEKKGIGRFPQIGFDRMLETIHSDPQFRGLTWEDVQRVDVRPSKGMAKWTLKDGWEVQIDIQTGELLQVEIRRSDWIESIHDGSFFAGDFSKLGVFLPAAVGLAGMLLTGILMFLQPMVAKRRKRKRTRSIVDLSS